MGHELLAVEVSGYQFMAFLCVPCASAWELYLFREAKPFCVIVFPSNHFCVNPCHL
jgi:hypothetical protein